MCVHVHPCASMCVHALGPTPTQQLSERLPTTPTPFPLDQHAILRDNFSEALLPYLSRHVRVFLLVVPLFVLLLLDCCVVVVILL